MNVDLFKPSHQSKPKTNNNILKTLKGKYIQLRALEPEDLEFIYEMENDVSVWEVSQTQTPYSKFSIEQYLENANQDIYEAKQLRLAICNIKTQKTIGLIDLFDFDPKNNRVGVGILIQNLQNRRQGIGSEALEILINYAFAYLNLNQMYANIDPENVASVRLFTKFEFQKIGTKKGWNLVDGVYKDETLFQLFKNKP